MLITSTENAKVAEVAKLLDKKYRKASGLYLIEGERLVSDALMHGAEITEIFVKESAMQKIHFDNAIFVADKVFAKMSDTVTSQGVVAVVKKRQGVPVPPKGNCLVLDGLQDPGNVGTLIRTAAACAFTDIYAVNTVDLYSPKVLRSAMSAHFCLNLWQTENLQETFQLLKDCAIVAADMKGANVFSSKFHGKVALVLGNEGNGLSEFSRKAVQQTVSLPMENNFESLNVAVAGSVIMYQIYAKTQTK